MKRLLAMSLLILTLATAHAAPPDLFAQEKTADELAKNLLVRPIKEVAQAQVLRGKFVHKKYLSEIPAPLEATGDFLFLRNLGLYWHTRAPFDSVFVLTPTAAFQKDEGGAAVKMDAAQPAVHAAAGIFMALFAIDLKALSNEFHLFGASTAAGWELGLRPKNAAMSAVFTEAIVRGAAQVHDIELRDAHGDRTNIRLLDTELSAREPTAAERALLKN